jgi:hypothetical protein
MNIVKYKNHEIKETNTSTETRRGYKNLYEISGECGKSAGVRPFITSVSAAKRYISQALE